MHGATQVNLGFLPARNTDFIFAVVGETYGFVGAAVVLSLYALLIWRALRILTMAKNLYGTLIAGGVLAMLMFQVFVNAGMTIGIMPITGVPLAADELRRLLGARDVYRHRPSTVDLYTGTDDSCVEESRIGFVMVRCAAMGARPHEQSRRVRPEGLAPRAGATSANVSKLHKGLNEL